jgi:hypothetical protein
VRFSTNDGGHVRVVAAWRSRPLRLLAAPAFGGRVVIGIEKENRIGIQKENTVAHPLAPDG